LEWVIYLDLAATPLIKPASFKSVYANVTANCHICKLCEIYEIFAYYTKDYTIDLLSGQCIKEDCNATVILIVILSVV